MILLEKKNQNKLIDYFLQGRNKNCSVIYITQSYYSTPKDIRLNCHHYILYDCSSKPEITRICKELGVN